MRTRQATLGPSTARMTEALLQEVLEEPVVPEAENVRSQVPQSPSGDEAKQLDDLS